MADFEQHRARLDEHDMRVVALSCDPIEDARHTVEAQHLGYPVLHGLDANETARAIGCYTGVHEGRPHVQPAAFVLDHEGRIVLAVYSSGKLGRLTGADALTLARELRKKREAAG